MSKSFYIVRQEYVDAGLSSNPLLVYSYIANMEHNTGSVHPTINGIARATGCCVSAVRGALETLCECGFIERKRINVRGFITSYIYTTTDKITVLENTCVENTCVENTHVENNNVTVLENTCVESTHVENTCVESNNKNIYIENKYNKKINNNNKIKEKGNERDAVSSYGVFLDTFCVFYKEKFGREYVNNSRFAIQDMQDMHSCMVAEMQSKGFDPDNNEHMHSCMLELLNSAWDNGDSFVHSHWDAKYLANNFNRLFNKINTTNNGKKNSSNGRDLSPEYIAKLYSDLSDSTSANK